MNKRRLGKTDIEITPIGLGCWQFSSGPGNFWGDVEQATVDAIVRSSLAGGIDWFDTAELYGKGKSEQALSRALTAAGKKDGDVIVATKWWPLPRTAWNIKRTIQARQRYLAPFSIDLHQVHQPFALATTKQQMNAMADLVSKKKVRSVGVSNYWAKKMRAAHAALIARGLPLASNQVQYSLLDRKIESNGVLSAAKELGVTIIAYSPLAKGLLSGKFHDDPSLIKRRGGPRKMMPDFREAGLAKSRPVVDAVQAIAKAHGATPTQVALAWLIQFHGDTVVAIPGATKESHVSDNVGALRLTLSPSELAKLDDVSRPFL
jgi:aryl-alcohol dehydrogenase-like predicted oxidoreductase